MRRIIIALILIMILACLIGCGSDRLTEEARIVQLLPPDHTNLKKLGNQWFSYDLEVCGKKRQFVVRYSVGSRGEYSLAVTELHEGK